MKVVATVLGDECPEGLLYGLDIILLPLQRGRQGDEECVRV